MNDRVPEDPAPEDLAALAEVLHDALEDGNAQLLVPILAPDVIWGDCSGRDDVVALVDAASAAGFSATDVTIEVAPGRLVACLSFGSGDEAHRSFQAVFVEDGKIVEIADSPTHEAARAARPMQRGGGAVLNFSEVAPVLPVRDVGASLSHYERLGFSVHQYEGAAAYGYASRGSVNLHLARVVDVDPKKNMCSIYLYVSDADATFLEWRASGAEGRLVAPQDTDYGLREGAHIDPDGNLIRFGSPLA